MYWKKNYINNNTSFKYSIDIFCDPYNLFKIHFGKSAFANLFDICKPTKRYPFKTPSIFSRIHCTVSLMNLSISGSSLVHYPVWVTFLTPQFFVKWFVAIKTIFVVGIYWIEVVEIFNLLNLASFSSFIFLKKI